MSLIYRIVNNDDEEKLSRFNEEACGVLPPPGFWKWKYFENPAGPPAISIALEGERVVGRVGVIPVKVRVDSEEVMVSQAVDIDILEEYRKGVTFFFRLESMMRERAKDLGIDFEFGFAIETTRKLATKALGFTFVAPVSKLVKIIDPIPYITRRLKIPYLHLLSKCIKKLIVWKEERLSGEDVDTCEVYHFDRRFDDLWKKITMGNIMVVKDSTYLNWRYFKCPAVTYKVYAAEDKGKLKGFIVFHTIDKGGIRYGIIADLLYIPEATGVAEGLISTAVKDFVHQGVASIICWLPKHHPLYRILRRKGFLGRSTPHYLIVRPHKKNIPIGILKEEANWFYMLGDSDYHIIPRKREEAP